MGLDLVFLWEGQLSLRRLRLLPSRPTNAGAFSSEKRLRKLCYCSASRGLSILFTSHNQQSPLREEVRSEGGGGRGGPPVRHHLHGNTHRGNEQGRQRHLGGVASPSRVRVSGSGFTSDPQLRASAAHTVIFLISISFHPNQSRVLKSSIREFVLC